MKALILVDLQTDFLPGGPLPVPNGDAVIPVINQLQGLFRMVVATQDWHPANHRSFFANHLGRVAGERVKVGRHEVELGPVHAVQNTRGAELASALMLNRLNKIIRKGTDADIDDSSGFFDAQHQRVTGLSEFLQEKKVKRVYLCGLRTETTLKATALDALGLGFQTWVIEDACASINPDPDAARNAWAEVTAAGGKLIQSQTLLSDIKFRLRQSAR